MKKFKKGVLYVFILMFFVLSGCNTTDDDSDTGNTGNDDTANTGTTDNGDTIGDNDISNTGTTDDSDRGDTVIENDSDSGDTVADNDSGDTAEDGIITKIQKGEIDLNTEVSFECVVVGIVYNQDSENDYANLSIKGLFVSELIETAKPYSGIYVFVKDSAELDSYAIGDKISVTGTYEEYYENSQINAQNDGISKLGTANVPNPAQISDPSKVSTPFEDVGGTWTPTTNHGTDAESYEDVLIEVSDVSVTNDDLGHGSWEVTGNLAVDKMMYYYSSRTVGKKFTSITGVLVYSYSAFRLEPRSANDIIEDTSDTGDDSNTGSDDDVDTGDTGTTVTIKAIQSGTKTKGDLVTIENAVIISPVKESSFTDGSKGYTCYVSTGTPSDYSGLYVYKITGAAAVTTGDVVSVEGQIDYYGNQWEIKNASSTGSITKTGTGTVPAVVSKTYATLTDADKGSYVQISDAGVTVSSVDSYSNYTLSNGLILRPTFVTISGLSVGDAISSVKGIYDVAYGSAGLQIIDNSDIVK